MRRFNRDRTLTLEFKADGSVRRLPLPPEPEPGPGIVVGFLSDVPPPLSAAPPREKRPRRSQAPEPAPAAPAQPPVPIRVMSGFRPPPGRILFADPAALLVAGPLGAVSAPAGIARALAVLAAGGRHPEEALTQAGGWRDAAVLHAALGAFEQRLAAVGLALNRKKAGWRITPLKISSPGSSGKRTRRASAA